MSYAVFPPKIFTDVKKIINGFIYRTRLIRNRVDPVRIHAVEDIEQLFQSPPAGSTRKLYAVYRQPPSGVDRHSKRVNLFAGKQRLQSELRTAYVYLVNNFKQRIRIDRKRYFYYAVVFDSLIVAARVSCHRIGVRLYEYVAPWIFRYGSI